MKKSPNILLITLIVFIQTACFKEDKIPPTIKLKGLPIVIIPIGSTYIEEGVIAEDDRDKDITYLVKATGTADTETAGQYYIRYNVNDASGNHAAEATRTVYITHETSTLRGIYEATETCNLSGNNPAGYFITFNEEPGNKYLIYLKNFNELPDNKIISADIRGNTRQSIIIPQQIIADTVYSGEGTINSTGTEITIDFSRTYNSIVDSCSLILTR